nr:hypothetical protein [Escherichia coli]
MWMPSASGCQRAGHPSCWSFNPETIPERTKLASELSSRML